MRVYSSQTDDTPESKVSNAPENDSSAVSLLRWELKKDCQDDYKEERESKARKSLWLAYRIVNKVTCSLEGGYAS